MENIDVNTLGDQIQALSETMSKYGTSSVLIATGVVLFIIIVLALILQSQKHTKEALRQNQELTKNMIEQNGEMVKTLLNHLENQDPIVITNREEPQNKPKLVATYVDISLGLKNICKSVLQKIKCDRVGVYVFHNGNKSIHGLPFFKMSCIGEWTARGASSNMGKIHSDLPLYLFSNMIESLYEDGEYIVEDVLNESREDQQIFEFVNVASVASVAAFGIKDENDNLAGFTVVEYRDKVNLKQDVSIHEQLVKEMNDINKTIGDIIIDSDMNNRITDSRN